MKRLLRPLAAGVIIAGTMSGAALADTSGCDISYTGANSNNVCVNVNKNETTVTCDNNLDVYLNNSQNSGSGSVTLTQNTSGGYSYSGSASNTNVTNLKTDVSCGPVTTASTTPTTPSGGQGGATESATTQTSSLPNTGSNPLAVSALAAAALGVVAIASRLGAKAFAALRS